MTRMAARGPGRPASTERETAFATSGSTGEERRWYRRPEQMEREVTLICGLLIGPVDLVVGYAPEQHLFGALFGQWLPRLAGVRVHRAWTDPFVPPPVRPGERVLVVCIPMAWDLLRRGWPALAQAGSVVALHSSAAPPRTARDLVRHAGPLLQAHEILGSTETGGVAHRQLTAEEDTAGPWQAFPDVDFVRPPGPPGNRVEELVVRGPRLARPEDGTRPPRQWATGDLVEFAGPRAFHFVGRGHDLLKVNGFKVHLPRVRAELEARLPQAEWVVLPLPTDPLAGEGYAVLWASPDRRIGAADVRAALRDFPGPSRTVELPAVPRTTSGKPDRRALLAALRPPGAPPPQ